MLTAARHLAACGLVVALAATGCAGDAVVEGPIPTVPEADPPPVPRLEDSPSASVDAATAASTPLPSPSPPPPTGPSPSDPAPAETRPADPRPAETRPADASTDGQPTDDGQIARDLGLDGLVELLASDPDAIGDRGGDLVRDLRRIRDRPDRRRIEQLQRRLADWVEAGTVDPQVGEAVAVVLDDALAAAPQSGPRDDDDDDDDD